MKNHSKSKKTFRMLSIFVTILMTLQLVCVGTTAEAEIEADAAAEIIPAEADVLGPLSISTQSISAGTTYFLRNAKSGLYLDLQASGVVNGTHFQQYPYGDPSEMFLITALGGDKYQIRTTLTNASGTMVMDGRSNCVAGAQVILYTYNSSYTEQQWKIESNTDGSYCISPMKNTSLNLTIENGSTASHAKAKLAVKNSSDLSQRWFIEPYAGTSGVGSTNAKFFIRNKGSGKYVDLYRNAVTSGTHFQQYQFADNSSAREKFWITSFNKGYVQISTTEASGGTMVMDGSPNCVAGAQVILNENDGTTEQYWYFRRNDDGSYWISPSKNVYLNLAVENSSTANNAKLKLESRSTGDNQKWYLGPVDEANFYFRYMFTNANENSYITLGSGYKMYRETLNDWHYAIDITGKTSFIRGTPIFSPTSGTVIYSQHNPESGNYVVIETDKCVKGTGKKVILTFAHMIEKSPLEVGQRVLPKKFIGYVGSTGNSSGDHLHHAVFKSPPGSNTIYESKINCINPQRFYPNVPFAGETSTAP